ncbi:MAG: hypothetical protein ABFD62_00760 [Syntrophaceae bacterium]
MNGSRQEDLSRLPRQGFELMFQGMDLYNRMIRYWMDSAEMSLRGKPDDAAKNISDTYSNVFRESINQFFKPLQSVANPSELFRIWQNFFSTSLFGMVPQQIGVNRLTDFSKLQQDRINKLANSWIDYLSNMGEAYNKSIEGKGDGQIVRQSLDKSESLLNSWLSFVTEESRDSFRVLRSSIEDQVAKSQEQQTQQQ